MNRRKVQQHDLRLRGKPVREAAVDRMGTIRKVRSLVDEFHHQGMGERRAGGADAASSRREHPRDFAEVRDFIESVEIAKHPAEEAAWAERNRKAQERDNAREESRHAAMDAAMAAAISIHRQELEAAHADNNLPEWFDRLLDRCLSEAYEGAREAAEEAERRAYDATFNEIYATTLSELLAKALAEYDAKDLAG